MRLSKIKLAGFKSFVDPTTVFLPGNLTAIVGPNGCGKSNVIDAVRWVMGESSARHLRGESMADVIFSGSASRKPVGQASIELVFDNSRGSLGGAYGAFAEIAVRRQVNRDGQSVYSLNGTRCRRRDVTDLFLGTGLGPRSYAIIEQGMISRVVEARPEELRQYLEEAAGISLYRERRRETERRIADTRENLTRLGDVREEVERQLQKLQRQARAAERYRALQAELRTTQGQWLALRLRHHDVTRVGVEAALSAARATLEESLGQQRSAERTLTGLREAERRQQRLTSETQARYYQLGSDLARIDQAIAHERQLLERLDRQNAAAATALKEAVAQLAEENRQLQAIDARLAELEPEHQAAVDLEADAVAGEARLRSQLEQRLQAHDRCRSALAAAERVGQVEQARAEGLERRLADLEQRLQALAQERSGLDPAPIHERKQALQSELEQRRREGAALADAAGEWLRQRDEQVRRLRDLDARLADCRSGQASVQAELASLGTVQQEALGGTDREAVERWLEQAGLADAGRLLTGLDVEPEWRLAVEGVLGSVVQACLVDTLEPVPTDPPEAGSVMLVARGHPGEPASASDAPGVPLPLLLDRVRTQLPVQPWLSGVHCAGTVEQALMWRERLPAGGSIVLPDGRWFGRDWLRLSGPQATDGILARAARMVELEEQLAGIAGTLAALVDEREDATARERACREALEGVTSRREKEDAEAVRLESRLEESERALLALADRQEGVARQETRLQEEREAARQERAASVARRDAAVAEEAQLQEQWAALERTRADARLELDRAGVLLAEARERRQAARLELERLGEARRTRLDQRTRLQRRQDQADGELQAVARERSGLADADDGRRSSERDGLATERQAVERQLADQREADAALERSIQAEERTRLQAEEAVAGARASVESTRLREQELAIRRQALVEQLLALDLEPDAALAGIPDGAEEAAWKERVRDLEQKIERLGAINLAAIDEHGELAERKVYLDAQIADLEEALATLEQAMARIDRETRARFRETFDRVNAGLKQTYPKLFGGGDAYLELTGEDLLETGVRIMARPPGKRVTRIQLLSGGEKALTAVGLVFAIFALNPAPFCMLDEVDAPLDEANVGRFCGLVEEMAERVQFIVITHNKTTMAMAGHLLGVTMREAGVSRLVSVDVTAAAELADA